MKIIIGVIYVIYILFFAFDKQKSKVKNFAQINKHNKSFLFYKNNEDNFQIGVYYIPQDSVLSPRIYSDLQKAHINFVQYMGNQINTDRNRNILALKTANIYNIKLCITDTSFASTDLRVIKSAVDAYKNYPALFGYYIYDEPNASQVITAATECNNIRIFDNTHVTHVNLLPAGSFDYTGYATNYIQHWINFISPINLNYLSSDYYPFKSNEELDEFLFFTLETIRSTGFQNKVNTSFYIQSVGGKGIPARMAPSASQMRCSAYILLAYGIKYPVWFTYSQPYVKGTNYFKEFTPAITDTYGIKTSAYIPFKQLNSEMQQLGKTLKHLDADKVFQSGVHVSLKNLQYLVPSNYLFFPSNKSKNIIISHFLDRNSKDEYIMIVNKEYHNSQTLSFKINSCIRNITEISKTSGKEVSTSFDVKNHTISLNFTGGDGRLFKIYKNG